MTRASTSASLSMTAAPASAWPVLVALGLAVFASVTSELLPPGLILRMSATLTVSPAAIGALVTVWAVTIVVTTLPMVRLTARIPRKPLLLATLLVFAASNALVALVPVYGVVVGARVLGAAAAGLSWAVVMSYVPDLVPQRRLGRAMSIVLGGGTLASVAGVPIGAWAASAGQWQLAFWGAAAALVLAAVVLTWRLPRRAGAAPGSGAWSVRGPRGASGWRKVLVLLGAGALLLTGYMTLYAYIVPVLVDEAAVPEGAISGVLFGAGAAGALGLVLSGAVGDRWPRAVFGALIALVPIGAAVIAASGGVWWVGVTGVVLIGFAVGGFPPLFQAQVMRTASPGARELAGSFFIVVLNIGIGVGVALGAVLLESAGTRVLALVAAGVTAVAFAIITLSVARSTPAASAPPAPAPPARAA